MKALDNNELRQKTVKELIQLRTQTKKELFNLRMKNAMRGLKTTHHIDIARKNVARINTALTHKLKQTNGNNR